MNQSSPQRLLAVTAVVILGIGALGAIATQRGNSAHSSSNQTAAPIASPDASGGQTADLASTACANNSAVPCMPGTFASEQVASVAAAVDAVKAQADTATKSFLDSHAKRDDKAFVAYVVQQLGTPPTGDAQTAEIADLHTIANARNDAGLTLSAWLELHGNKDIWNYYASIDSLAGKSKAHAKAIKSMTKLVNTLSKQVASKGKSTYQRTSPYQVDPTLNGQNQAKYAGKTRYSYPSSHSIIAAGDASVLGAVDPSGAGTYTAIEAQIDFSRMYAGGHYLSDVVRGAFAGQMLGDYARHYYLKGSF